MLKEGKTRAKELMKKMGRWVHVGAVLPHVYHFLSRLRDLQHQAKNRRAIKINSICKVDLKLMLFFLTKAKEGVSMNLLAYRCLAHVYGADSCPHGLGGYSHRGWGWRWYLPHELLF